MDESLRIEIFPADVEVTTSDPVDPARRSYPAMTEIVIEVDDVHATRERIVEQGIEPTEDLQNREWGLTDFRVTDPDGYYLQFTSRAS